MTILEHTGNALYPAIKELSNGKSKLFISKNGIIEEINGGLFSDTSIVYVISKVTRNTIILNESDVLQFYSVK